MKDTTTCIIVFNKVIIIGKKYNYRGVGQTRMIEIVKKPSELPRPVRITPTVWITQIVPKTDFPFEIANYFLQKI